MDDVFVVWLNSEYNLIYAVFFIEVVLQMRPYNTLPLIKEQLQVDWVGRAVVLPLCSPVLATYIRMRMLFFENWWLDKNEKLTLYL